MKEQLGNKIPLRAQNMYNNETRKGAQIKTEEQTRKQTQEHGTLVNGTTFKTLRIEQRWYQQLIMLIPLFKNQSKAVKSQPRELNPKENNKYKNLTQHTKEIIS